MSSSCKSVVLTSRPKGNIIPSETFRTVEKPWPKESDLHDEQVLLEVIYLSLDPAMRGWMNDVRSYIPPVQIDETMRGATICKVVASKSSKFQAGDYATALTGWTEAAIISASQCEKIEVPSHGRLSDALGPLGLTGMTAYFGLFDVGKPKAGELVVVSGAAGATGSMVCQFAKLQGCRVVAIAGSSEKVQWLKSIGCEAALDYKAPDFKDEFKKATKDYIDVYFDNVGGEILEMALSRAKEHSRFVMCGAISQYNDAAPKGPRNFQNIIKMRIRMEGFIVFDFAAQYPKARKEIAQWLADGKIDRKESIIKGGIRAAPEALVSLYEGANIGKMLVEIKSPENTAKL